MWRPDCQRNDLIGSSPARLSIMDEIFFDLMEFLKQPSVTETFVDILLCAVPIWLAVMIGLVIGWSWRPRWTGLLYLGFRSKLRFLWTVPPGLGARRLWFAFTALSVFSVCRTFWSRFCAKSQKFASETVSEQVDMIDSPLSHMHQMGDKDQEAVSEYDLKRLLYLLEGQEEELEWQCMMEKTIPNMSYQAWCHEPETGPLIYRSRTVFEDADPDMVRDFFWDDEFRPKWDPMLAMRRTLEENHHTGVTIVHWIKKFPFFCSDREYIIGRRIWESRKAYYCVTKAMSYSAVPKRERPRRVENYFSSWVIRAVESGKGDGHKSACEVVLFHCEDMGIPKDIAKLGVRHGMWGAVKKLNSGFRAYQNIRRQDGRLSASAIMAKMTTKFSTEEDPDYPENNTEAGQKCGRVVTCRKREHGVDWRWIVIGGVALAFGMRSGVGKALLVGAGQRMVGR